MVYHIFLLLPRKWLQEALTSISNAPSETDLLKAALAVMKSHLPSVKSGSLSDGDKQALLTATEDTLYFIEDLDHANGEDLMSHECNVNYSKVQCNFTGNSVVDVLTCAPIATTLTPYT